MGRLAHRYTSCAYPLGSGYEVTFIFDGASFDAHWAPAMPEPEIARTLVAAYLKARNRFVDNIVKATGLTIAIVDAE